MLVYLLPSVYAEDYFVYVEELPSWAADNVGNVMYDSTQAWQEANPGLNFYLADSEIEADFSVRWVRDFGGEHIGYAYGDEFIEVGLGDSNCVDQWNPYSEKHISDIMVHEIGHILGHQHNDDPESIMYPISLNLEYGIVSETYRLTEGYGQYIPFCTIKDLTSYEFKITTTDETYGFDYYVVPSDDEFTKWIDGEPFQHYSSEGCFGTNWLSISATCEGVGEGSGIFVLMPDTLTTPLETITIDKLEASDLTLSPSSLQTKDPNVDPTTPNTVLPNSISDNVHSKIYHNDEYSFLIEYPDGWEFNDTIYDNDIVTFSNGPDVCVGLGEEDGCFWDSYISILKYTDAGAKQLDIVERKLQIDFHKGYCKDLTFDVYGVSCKNFKVEKEISPTTTIDGFPIITTIFSMNMDYSDDSFDYLDVTSTSSFIYVGNDVWEIITESETYEKYEKDIMNTINSFKFTTTPPLTTTLPTIKTPTIEREEVVRKIPTLESEPTPVVSELTCGIGTEAVDGICQVVESEPEPILESEPEPILESEPEPILESEPTPVVSELTCGIGTEAVDGICQVVESEPEPTPVVPEPICGTGTEAVDGICQVIESKSEPDSGCLIATAAYGTELAPQVQLLREIRDNTLFSTTSGTVFMSEFNTLYYSFAPTVADWERENPMFKEITKIMITPMLSTLSIMSLADEGSEIEVLGLGISVIVLNLTMYIGIPVFGILKLCQFKRN